MFLHQSKVMENSNEIKSRKTKLEQDDKDLELDGVSSSRYYLYSEDNPEIEPIHLPHNCRIFVGRDPRTKIKDLKCSKRQLSIVANYKTRDIEVRHEGQTEAVIDGKIVSRKETVIVRPQTTIELRPGQHKFLIRPDNSSDMSRRRYAFWMGDVPAPDLESLSPKKKKICLDRVASSNLKSNIPPGWTKHETLLMFRTDEFYDRPLVAAFDLDGTIIKTKSGSVFPKDKDDWRLWHEQVKTKLEQLHSKNYKIVILTNQGGMSCGRTNQKDFNAKIENITAELNIPLLFFIATTCDKFRKPAPGMWNYMVNKSATPVFYPGCIMVGDAAGRVNGWAKGKKKDFSCSDRLFAKNLGLEFFTPEEFFLGDSLAPFCFPPFSPEQYEDCDFNLKDLLPREKQEVIMMVGAPGSGKTSFCEKKLIPHGYQHISRDDLKTWQKCISILDKTLGQKKSAVVDNVNSDPDSRKRYLDVCKKYNVPVRCFVMKTCKSRCLHNNLVRQLSGNESKRVPSTYIMKIFNTFVNPSVEEGFDEIISVPFFPSFPSLKEQDLYNLHYDILN